MIEFQKYHGLGNDFIIIEDKKDLQSHYSYLAKTMCNRKTNIGADGLIVVCNYPLKMVYYNSDGTRAPMCGNGIRCFSHYIYKNNLNKNLNYDVLTDSGIFRVSVKKTDNFKAEINLGVPSFDIKNYSTENLIKESSITIDNKNYKITSLFLGTIHTIIFVENIELIDVNYLGRKICNHNLFPFKTNVNFVEVIDKNNINLKTYERGVGVTLACGTGASSSVYVSSCFGYTNKSVKVHLKHGTLKIKVDNSVYLIGPSKYVYKGLYKDVKLKRRILNND